MPGIAIATFACSVLLSAQFRDALRDALRDAQSGVMNDAPIVAPAEQQAGGTVVPTIENAAVGDAEARIAEHCAAGEFSIAIKSANHLPQDRADFWLAQISGQQYASGAIDAALESVAAIGADAERTRTLSVLSSYGVPAHNDVDMSGGGGSFGNLSGAPGSGPAFGGLAGPTTATTQNGGGVTIGDFQPLMELIQQTIVPDSWSDANGEGTITAYPSGVYVDAGGLMQRIESGQTRMLETLREESAFDEGQWRWTVESDVRKISLNRLEKAAQLSAFRGRAIDDEMLNLAGMYEIQYVMLMPESGDIVIAGPAGPWTTDVEGRRINQRTGKPVLQLDDLVVCLRNAFEDNGTFGCSINPRTDNLTQTRNFVETSNLNGKRWRQGLQEALGRQDVEVFGIDPQTHAGYVLVEADYRMKLIGMGLEPSIAEIPSYLSRVKIGADGTAPPMDVVRWWFTLNYDDVSADASREIFAFTGSGVKVLSENEMLDQRGQRVHTGQTSGPTKEFAEDFTEHFDAISARYPVYRQLKNVFDLAIVSSLIQSQELAGKADWNLTYFGSDESPGPVYQPAMKQTPDEVNSVMNHREIRERKEHSTVKHTIVGVSGGVEFTASMVTADDKISTDRGLDDTASQMRSETVVDGDSMAWWWD